MEEGLWKVIAATGAVTIGCTLVGAELVSDYYKKKIKDLREEVEWFRAHCAFKWPGATEHDDNERW